MNREAKGRWSSVRWGPTGWVPQGAPQPWSYHIDKLDQLQPHSDLHNLTVVLHWPDHAAIVFKEVCHQTSLMLGAQNKASWAGNDTYIVRCCSPPYTQSLQG